VNTISSALNNVRKPLNGSRVLVLGVSYKKDIDDLRESPALTIIELLRQQGAIVSFNDPYFPVLLKGRHYNLQMERVPLDEISKYDCVVIITDHSDYDYAAIVREAQLVVDTRNATRGIDSAKVVRC
jgi:UDP-N-acetyl-D-glucosamine dehydrogenase